MSSVINLSKAARPERQSRIHPQRFQVYTERQLERIEALQKLPAQTRFEMRAVASVLPFRVNRYVVDNLIDWDAVPDDPIFQLTFPQRDMLADAHFQRMASALREGADKAELNAIAWEIRRELNPHPAGQQQLNVPTLDGEPLPGMQHKYRETVLFFPSQGQTCHSYCSFCFRWAQFVGDKDLRFAAKEADHLHRYLNQHREVSDLLVTGGDPMVMKTDNLAQYLSPLTDPELEHVQTVRIGSKALSFWPYRFVTDADADDLLRLLERLVHAGKHVAFMAHFNHWRELETPVVREAIRRIRDTGRRFAASPLWWRISTMTPRPGRACGVPRCGWASYLIICLSNATPERNATLRFRCCAPGTSIAMQCSRCQVWRAPPADRA